MEGIIVYTDGGARGNPGPAAIGVYIIDQDGKQVIKFGKKIGETTNNVAEYKAVYNALDWIKNNLKNNIRNINFLLDSKLVVNQLNGIFKIKNKNLGRLYACQARRKSVDGGDVLQSGDSRYKRCACAVLH